MSTIDLKAICTKVKEGVKLSPAERAPLEKYVAEIILECTAYHEAGHAVIARAMGQLTDYVTIEKDGDSGGRTIFLDIWETYDAWDKTGRLREPPSILVGRIISIMAGVEAEQELAGQTIPGGDKNDRIQIDQMLNDLLPDESAEYFSYFEARLRRWAKYFVLRYRNKIKLVGLELLKRKTLSSNDVDLITGMRSI